MFKKTTKENKHYHIALITPDGTRGITSQAKDGHRHEIASPALMGMGDMTGDTGQLLVMPAPDGHMHKLIDIEVPEKKVRDSDKDDLVARVVALRQEIKNYDKESRDMARKCEDFYSGDKQWDGDSKAQLEGEKRAALTLNHIQPKVHAISGYYRRNRHDFKFFPVEGGDVKIADMMTAVVKSITSKNNFDYTEVRVLEDGMIPGRGNLNAYVDFNRNPTGEPDIIIEQFPWEEVGYGPHELPDASDAEYMIKSKMYSLARARQLWPEHKDELKQVMDDADKEGKLRVTPGHQYSGDGKSVLEFTSKVDEVDIAKKELRVSELWELEYVKVPVAVFNDSGQVDVESLEGWADKDVQAVKTLPAVTIVEKMSRRMHVVQVAGGSVLLGERYDDDVKVDGEATFGCIPFYYEKRGRKWWGLVKIAIDPQREINKRFSQVADACNNMNGKGWFIYEGSFADTEEEAKFKADSSVSGWVVKVADKNLKPEKEEGTQFPAGLVEYALMASNQLSQLMGINPEMVGLQSNATTGKAIAEKRDAGLTGQEPLFDNFAFSKRRLCKIVVGLVQKHYTPERVYRLLANFNERSPIDIGGSTFNDYSIEQIKSMLDNMDLLNYDIVVGESAYSPTKRMESMRAWMELAATPVGQVIPPEFYLELSDMADKDKMMGMIQQERDRQMQMEQGKQDTEIQKTIIAAANKPGQENPAPGAPQQ